MKTLVVVGAGGHGKVCADIAERTRSFGHIAFSDDGKPRGTHVARWRVEYHDDDLSALGVSGYVFILGVGQVSLGTTREALFERIQELGLSSTSVFSPDAAISSDSTIDVGTFVGSMGIVNAGAQLGRDVIINSRALVEHDAIVEDHTHISTGAIVNGEAIVGARCLIGSGSVILHGVSICDDVVIGAGAVVTQTIVQPGTYVGVPARKIHE